MNKKRLRNEILGSGRVLIGYPLANTDEYDKDPDEEHEIPQPTGANWFDEYENFSLESFSYSRINSNNPHLRKLQEYTQANRDVVFHWLWMGWGWEEIEGVFGISLPIRHDATFSIIDLMHDLWAAKIMFEVWFGEIPEVHILT